ncbi:MAG: hypothetical protein KKE81_01215, partial [Candidatus Omnitrophica bacterium]|nr:hypothetical protein [Candidatus Omnitrophota bacterium]
MIKTKDGKPEGNGLPFGRQSHKGEIEGLKGQIQKGKGVDIGTMFVKCAHKEGDEIVFKSQRNAFFDVEHTDFTKKILDNSKVKYIIKG